MDFLVGVLRVWGIIFVTGALIGVILRIFIFSTLKISGKSMEPAYFDGENVLINKRSYLMRQPKRFDTIVHRLYGSKEKYIKRIIALPDEKLEIRRGGQVFINGMLLEDDKHRAVACKRYKQYSGIVPSGAYFVMGDNRRNSIDSMEYGTVFKHQILGKAVAVLWPMNKARVIKE